MNRPTLAALLGVPLLALGASPAFAQAQDPDTAIRLNLSPPGARSLGLGGAFVGLADDATAAYTNPAGLTNLTLGGSEVAVEARYWQFANSHLDRGREFGDLTGIGIDTVSGLERSEASSGASGLSFLSFGWVLPRGITLAFYRHELVRFETSFETQGPLSEDAAFGASRALPRRSRTAVEVVNYGLSGAYEFDLPSIESAVSVGFGLALLDLDLFSHDDFYNVRLPVLGEEFNRRAGGFFGPPDFLDDNLLYFQEQTADGQELAFNVGWLWKIGRARKWSVGGVFRKGAEFDTLFTLQTGEFGPLGGLSAFPGTATGVLNIPDSFALGAAFRASGGKTRLTLDWSRVRYSQRLIDFTLPLERFRQAISALPEGNPIKEYYSATDFDAYIAGFEIDDSEEIRLGIERVFLVVESLFVGTARVGAWHEPFHELEFNGEDRFTRSVLDRPMGGELHLSTGLGLVIKEDYQIDLAADFSDVTNTFSISLVKFL